MAFGTKFVNIMMPDLMERMKVPSAYCEKLQQEKSRKAVLKTPKGSWEMKVRRDDDGDIVFEDGWPRFARDHALNDRDFLAFEHTGNLHFDVVVCDARTACEKKPIADCRNAMPQNQDKGKAEKKGVIESQIMPSFSIDITPYIVPTKFKSPVVGIPAQFARRSNLDSKKSISLRDPKNRKWPINLIVKREPYFRVSMCGGWRDFYAANAKHLKIGDKCILHLNSTSSTSKTAALDVEF
ncbi:B3 domain-containing protein REM16-like [Salvia miltiorrhiza]|uniref:B3 domain-containing protein REM16-like n=1 Tax=Salvia miltiorrhiza TaxID=226208 RepID=UPI0025AD453B|nr:B3 domain-containing protein REM16-like [Salvia miltiorrhiza]